MASDRKYWSVQDGIGELEKGKMEHDECTTLHEDRDFLEARGVPWIRISDVYDVYSRWPTDDGRGVSQQPSSSKLDVISAAITGRSLSPSSAYFDLELIPNRARLASAPDTITELRLTMVPCLSRGAQLKHAHATGTLKPATSQWAYDQPGDYARGRHVGSSLQPGLLRRLGVRLPGQASAKSAAEPSSSDVPPQLLKYRAVQIDAFDWHEGKMVMTMPAVLEPTLLRVFRPRPRAHASAFGAGIQDQLYGGSPKSLVVGRGARWTFSASVLTVPHTGDSPIYEAHGGLDPAVRDFLVAHM